MIEAFFGRSQNPAYRFAFIFNPHILVQAWSCIMKKYFIYLSNQHNLIYKVSLLVLTVAVIAAILPRKEISRYDYQKGRTWTGDDLYAPFDFSILKDQDSLDLERREAVAEVLPHYVTDTTVVPAILEQVNSRFARSVRSDS